MVQPSQQGNLIFQAPEKAYECPKCKDKGVLNAEWEQDGRKISGVRVCDCTPIKQMRKKLAQSGIAEAFSACTFEKYEVWNQRVAQAKGVAQAYVNDFDAVRKEQHNSLALLGAIGSGKTFLGVCVMNELLNRGIAAFYVPYREMMQRLKSKITDRDYEEECQRYTLPPVLFVDDLFKGATANDVKYVYDIVNIRYLAKKPMIITSELYATDLVAIDEATGSRIIERCRNYIFELRGNDLNYRIRDL